MAGMVDLYRFHSYLNRFESLESLEFSVFFCGALDRNMIRLLSDSGETDGQVH
jgi:hypothetical protein